MGQPYLWVLIALSQILAFLIHPVSAITDPREVVALEDLYVSLNQPPELVGWKLGEGDPCEESWKGISCFGSSIIFIDLSGLNISGHLGNQLFQLVSLKQLNVSFNHINGEIPSSLPPNVTHIDLSFNNFSEHIPYSIMFLKYLHHLNLSHNSLSGPVGNIFTDLQNLKHMDLSYNNLTGDLPSSFENLKNLSGLFLQNNQLTGSVIYLANLTLVDLNIQNNHFSGVIPKQFQDIQNLWIGGNTFHVGADYSPWNFPTDTIPTDQNIRSEPQAHTNAMESYPSAKVDKNKTRRLTRVGVACIVAGVALFATCAGALIAIISRSPARVSHIESFDSNHSSFLDLPSSPDIDCSFSDLEENATPVTISSRLPSDRYSRPQNVSERLSFTSKKGNAPKIVSGRLSFTSKKGNALQIVSGRLSFSSKKGNAPQIVSGRLSFTSKKGNPPTATMYTVSELVSATNSFSGNNLLGEGSLGSVYKAEFPDGQVFAVKKVNTVSLSIHEEERFLDVIRNVAPLRHPNIIALVGYSMEIGHHLLVHEYVRNWTLEKALHYNKEIPLSWTVRMSIALGIARALDYLHSTCLPPIAHNNLKASNILLDDEFVPRLSDCGLSILRPLTSNSIKLKASELAISCTGYIAPENGQPGKDNTKSDVFAFGVLLLELLTGRRPFDSSRPQAERLLVQWASSQLHDYESLEEMIDPQLKSSVSSKSLSRFADIVSLCVQSDPEFRPMMSSIVESLMNMIEKSSCKGDEVDTAEMCFETTCSGSVASPDTSYTST